MRLSESEGSQSKRGGPCRRVCSIGRTVEEAAGGKEKEDKTRSTRTIHQKTRSGHYVSYHLVPLIRATSSILTLPLSPPPPPISASASLHRLAKPLLLLLARWCAHKDRRRTPTVVYDDVFKEDTFTFERRPDYMVKKGYLMPGVIVIVFK
jgi:hypothetical protein